MTRNLPLRCLVILVLACAAALVPAWAQRLPQSVQFTSPIPATSAGESFFVSATASSGLPVTFSASGPCSVSSVFTSHVVSFRSTAGTCTLTAAQAGNEQFEPASATATVERLWFVQVLPTVPAVLGQPSQVRIYYEHGGLPPMDTACAIDWEDPGDPGARLGTVQDDGRIRYCDFFHVYTTDGVFAAKAAFYDARYGYEMRVAYVAVTYPPDWRIGAEGTFHSPPGSVSRVPALAGTMRVQLDLRDPATNPFFRPVGVFSFEGTSARFTIDPWAGYHVRDVTARIWGSGRDHEGNALQYEIRVVDGGAGGADRIRLRLTGSSGELLYDSEPGSPPEAEPTGILSGFLAITRP